MTRTTAGGLSIFSYGQSDDRFTLILNGGDRQITIDDILLDDIEEYFDGVMSSCAECSPLVADAPPQVKKSEHYHQW